MARERTIAGSVLVALQRFSPTPTDMVMAVSGGPDSVALLRALAVVVPGRLAVAHLNHCLRGAESDADEAFVGRLVDALAPSTAARLTFHTERRDVATAGGNLEATARRIRYEWLAEVARAEGINYVATGHTADDQAETVLFRLLRGSGLAGLTGIAPQRPLAPGVELVRPLLDVGRADVLEYLRSLGQDYREDATNQDRRFTRSRIRHELLPRLAERYNPRVCDVLCRLAKQAVEALSVLNGLTDELIDLAERPRAGSLLVFESRALAGITRHGLRDLWRRVWEREGWPRRAMGFAEWDRLASFCVDGPDAIDLPGHIRARRRNNVVQVGPANGGW